MSAEIINFVPRPNPNRSESLDQMANEIMHAALYGVPVAFLTADTVWLADCVVPEKDPA